MVLVYVWLYKGGVQKSNKKMGGENRIRTEHDGTGAGTSVTTDGLQERVPISSLRVKQRGENREAK